MFTLDRKLPACKVDKDLLQAFETYLMEQLKQTFGHSDTDIARSSYLSIDDAFGTETIPKVADVRGEKFADSVRSITMRMGAYGSHDGDTRIKFDRGSYPKIEIK